MSGRAIDCDAFARLIDRYFDDGLVERDALAAHAAGCANCRGALVRMTEELSDLPCQAFVEHVTDYLERAISATEGTRMTRHLELCQGCRIYLGQLRATIELTATPPEPPGPVLRAALVAAYRQIRGAPSGTG